MKDTLEQIRDALEDVRWCRHFDSELWDAIHTAVTVPSGKAPRFDKLLVETLGQRPCGDACLRLARALALHASLFSKESPESHFEQAAIEVELKGG